MVNLHRQHTFRQTTPPTRSLFITYWVYLLLKQITSILHRIFKLHYPKSQPFYQRYKSILPTSLTYIILINQRLITLETCCGIWYGLLFERSTVLSSIRLIGFSMAPVWELHRTLVLPFRLYCNHYTLQLTSVVTRTMFKANRGKSKLLRDHTNTSPTERLPCGLQL